MEWWKEQGYDSEAEALKDGAEKPSIFTKANARRDTYFKNVNTPQEYFDLISSDSYSPDWTTAGELQWVKQKFNIDLETAKEYRNGKFPRAVEEFKGPKLVYSEGSKKLLLKEEPEQITDSGLKNLNATLSLINKELGEYESFNNYILERPQDIKDILERNEETTILPEGSQEGFVLRINSKGELEGYDEKTGNIFNPRTEKVITNKYFPGEKKEEEKVVTPTKETVGISNDWNTDGSNIINLNGKRYALFEKGGSFRSAGSEEEFNGILGEGFTPIGNQNPLWLNFAQSENLDDIEIIITDDTSYDDEDIVTPSSQGESVETSTEVIDFNNVPQGSKLTEVDGKLYLMYAVPGQGQLYTGNTMYMAYEVVGNDIFSAGLLTEGATAPTANYSMDKTFFDTVAIVAGDTNQIIGIEDNPFASFVETYSEEAQLRPWLLDPEFIAIQAEAAIENREISDTEWRLTNWYQTHNQAERAWMDLELSDPAEAARQLDDLEIFYENQLSSLGVSGVPDGLVQWISSKNISGQWSDTYTAEQLNLFSDPYKSGDRDAELQNLISTSGFGDVDRTAAREREVVELYRKWLGPTLGSLTQDEVSSIAGRLRDDPDYEDALIQNLKQNRLAAFSNYTNPELTYEDIARPWRNLTTSVWGQTADETQGWWQEMVKTNDFAKAQETLRTKGLEQNVTQVTTDATQALQQALGQGQISQLGVNV
jgi:hypothetical protein